MDSDDPTIPEELEVSGGGVTSPLVDPPSFSSAAVVPELGIASSEGHPTNTSPQANHQRIAPPYYPSPMVARTTFALLLTACTATATPTTETTTGDPPTAQECLYDFDCGDQSTCHQGSCIPQCTTPPCCTLRGDLLPASPCESTEDCPDHHLCKAGLCTPEPTECSAPEPDQAYG